MTIEHWSDDILLLNLRPEPMLSEELLLAIDEVAAHPRHVVLDLSQAGVLNSSNLAQILRVRKVVIEQDRKLRLAAVPDVTLKVLAITGLDRIFDFAEDVPTALTSLQLDETTT